MCAHRCRYIKAAEKAQADFPDKRLRYGAVNSRVFGDELASPYGVTSYPWVTSFYLGENVGHMAGMGGWESFYRWGKKKVDEVWQSNGKANVAVELPTPKLNEEDDVVHDLAVAAKVAAAEKEARRASRSARENAYTVKWEQSGAAAARMERARLTKMLKQKGTLKPKLEKWLKQRIALLAEVATSGDQQPKDEL